nr:N-acetyl sugar amidotransferase [Pedobacter panaciterrae]
MKREYKICIRCVMDTTDPHIFFNEQGVCNHCIEYFQNAPKVLKHDKAGQNELFELVDKIKTEGNGKKYDCLIGLSGGVDSTYIAYKVKKLGLRPLAVHFDSGWNSELAVKNIENIVKRLEIDLFTFVCDWKEMQDLQLSYFKAGVINADIPMDHAFLAVLHKIAREKKLKYFISGHNFETEAILPRAWVYNAADRVNLIDIQKKNGSLKLSKYPTESLFTSLYTRFIFRLKQVNLLDFEYYNKEDAMKVIENELDWKYYGGKHYESVFTRFYQGYYLYKRFDVDKRKAHLSTLICSNQITRDQALIELNKPLYPDAELLRQDLEFIPKKLGITRDEFENILNQPVREHTFYKTDLKLRALVERIKGLIRN